VAALPSEATVNSIAWAIFVSRLPLTRPREDDNEE